RDILGLQKEEMNVTKFTVNARRLVVDTTSPGRLGADLTFDDKKAKPAPPFPPGIKPQYGVVTRVPKQEFFRTWSWVFSAESSAKCNEIKAGDFTYPKTKGSIWEELDTLGFVAMESTWTAGLTGDVENLAVIGPPPPPPPSA